MNIVERILDDRPIFHSGGTARWDCTPATLRAIAGAVGAGDQTIETGCGASTVVFAASGAAHTAISPDADEHERVRRYCESIGVGTDRLRFIVGFSDEVLPGLCRDLELDAAFIDGAHTFPIPIIDWHYITKALKVGGRLILDDVPVPAVLPLYRQMDLDPSWCLDGLLDNRAAAFCLLAHTGAMEWQQQPFNHDYPDYSFAPLPSRWLLAATTTATKARRSAGRHLRARRRRITVG